TEHSARVPDNQLPFAAELVDHGRRITEVATATLRSPDLLAGLLVERDHEPVVRTADQTDQLFPIDQRMRREAPDGQVRLVVLDEVLGPDWLAIRDIQTQEPTHRAECVDAIAVHNRCAARATGIADGVFGGVVVFPELPATLLVEAEHPFKPF